MKLRTASRCEMKLTRTYAVYMRCSQALGSLPGEKLARVLEIISEGANALATGGSADEVELDIDMLDNATLFKLDQYTTEILAVRLPADVHRLSKPLCHGKDATPPSSSRRTTSIPVSLCSALLVASSLLRSCPDPHFDSACQLCKREN